MVFSHKLHEWTRIPAILDEDLSGFRNVAKAKIESANYYPSTKVDGNILQLIINEFN